MKKSPRPKARTPQAERLPIHTPLTVDDRDECDTLHGRIKQHALIVQHILSTWDTEEVEYLGRPTLELGLIELCASIVTDADALCTVLTVAEKRHADGVR